MSQSIIPEMIIGMSGTLYDPVFPDPFDDGILSGAHRNSYNINTDASWEVIISGVSGPDPESSYMSTSFFSYSVALETRDKALRSGYCAIIRKIK